MSDKVRSESSSDERDRAGTDADHEPDTDPGTGPDIEVEVEVDAPEVDLAGVDVGEDTTVARLEAEKAQLEHEKKDTWDRLLRATADLDNFRKRAKRDVDEARIEARGRVLKEMLPVIDNLERALEHAESASGGGDGKDVSGIIEGVKLVLRQFQGALERCDVTAVPTEGPFDPNVHEAIGQAETAEQPPGSIVQVMQRGYKIGERLLRPALVMVAKAPPEEPAPGGNGSHPPEGAGNDAEDAES
jgi:molecular chaperone GrpE